MRRAERLEQLQSAILQRVAAAAASRDVLGVKTWGSAAEECQLLELDARKLDARIETLENLLDDGDAVANPARTSDAAASGAQAIRPPTSKLRSPRAEGAAARADWVNRLRASGIPMVGQGKRYHTRDGRSVAIAFANELKEYPNKWWLGLPDEPTDVAVLLCKPMDGDVLDVVLPVDQLGTAWRALSRSNGQIKFNVKRDGSDLVLLIPGSHPVTVKKYVANRSLFRAEKTS